ncbi:hypothetical protein [Bizionia paragorgiae]|uniref:Uncharacterized protein n=1 Tax=Bizionia paragorgiae TaxID=283786 RepID=A0A1H3ZQE3_BIZPA|nr:hypothetical protein [Bizionia paragorgiae]SEA25492.1 hypothetical protein SAMN04487990_1092 [Bizionia paragorgiae]
MKLLYTLVFMLTLSTYNVKAQSVTKQPLALVKYKDNVKAPLTTKELKMLKEVYGNNLEKEVLSRPQRVKDFKNLLRNRVIIKQMPSLVNYPEKYKLLSETGLIKVYNPNLTMDSSYNEDSFNVLKYNLQFFGKRSSVYRIDNTNYFIHIKSQHQ